MGPGRLGIVEGAFACFLGPSTTPVQGEAGQARYLACRTPHSTPQPQPPQTPPPPPHSHPRRTLPRPLAAVSATVDRSVRSEAASRNVTTARAWSSVAHRPTRAPCGRPGGRAGGQAARVRWAHGRPTRGPSLPRAGAGAATMEERGPGRLGRAGPAAGWAARPASSLLLLLLLLWLRAGLTAGCVSASDPTSSRSSSAEADRPGAAPPSSPSGAIGLMLRTCRGQGRAGGRVT